MSLLRVKLPKRLAYSNELSEKYTIGLSKEKRNKYCFLSCLVLCIFVFLYLSRNNYGTLTISDVNPSTKSFSISKTDQCDKLSNEDKFDCFPRGIPDSKSCLARNCCWSPANDLNVPWCYYSSSYESYKLINITKSKSSDVLLYDLVNNSSYPDNMQHIKVNVDYRNAYSLRIKIFDARNARFEPPYPEVPVLGKRTFGERDYNISFDAKNVGFTIVRSSTQETLFDTKNVGGFTFADQFLQLSAKLPTKYIYGLGERRNNFLLDINWTQITLFNHGNPPQDKINLYGSHPFFLGFDKSGLCFGVFLLNSNAMDIILQPTPAITYRTIGGIFDFFFFLGPSPADVIKQYLEVIGNPFLPPYWSLGFHLSRFGLLSVNDTINLWNKTRAATIPFDTQWNDIDYMIDRNDFTINDDFKQLPDFVAKLHEVGMRYVVILDPGIASREKPGTYPPYDVGLEKKIFVKDSTGKHPLEGKVWNRKGGTVFVDFTDPKSVDYWIQQVNSLYKNISMDGLWIDMNEIENFVDGSQTGCGDNRWEHPPYVPAVHGGVLNYRTLCMSAQQYAGVHYNVHNLYGFSEAMVTSFAMAEIRGKRPFILSRSTFSGFGHYAAHWTGDNFATWDDLKHSVFDIMSFNLFGIPMIGADICGFNGNTTVELCQRWSQLGAFYPFSRNHNSDDCIDQDPVSLGPSVVESTRTALLNRYRLLPYLYTLFFEAHNDGETVVRPLFFEFSYDKNTYTVNEQFLWGPALLITPVLYEGHVSVDVYFPNTTWFDFYTGKAIHGEGKIVNIPAPLNIIPLFVRSGFIIPFQEPGITTKDSREGGFGVLVAYNNSSQASGLLYWDDGESHNTYDDLKYNLLSFKVNNERFTSTVINLGYNTTMRLQSVSVFGIGQISSVSINGIVHGSFIYDASVEVLNIFDVNVDLTEDILIIWM